MKFGYFTLTDNPPGYGARRRDPNQLLREVVEECVEAEAMGYHSAWVTQSARALSQASNGLAGISPEYPGERYRGRGCWNSSRRLLLTCLVSRFLVIRTMETLPAP